MGVLMRKALHGILGGALLAPGASSADSVEVKQNEEVIQTWQKQNLGGQVPELTREEGGGTRIEWKGNINADMYVNDISTNGGLVNTPLRTGTYFKSIINSDLRGTNRTNDVGYFQFGVTNTNDRAILSQYPAQINNIQLGRAGQGYLIAFGDVAPNFSSLSSALGVRGIFGQRQFGGTTAYGFAGVVAESWEALGNRVPRNQYLRDVYGLKVETRVGATSLYGTAQAYSERAGSITSATLPATPAAKSRSLSGGFQFQQGQFILSGETASSSFEDGGTSNRTGKATIVDGNWRLASIGLRAGYHDLDSSFTSLSSAAQAGVREIYIAGDWAAAPWITLGADARNSKNTTLATAAVPSTTSDTDSVAASANINFGPENPGWALSVQLTDAKTMNASAQAARNNSLTSALNYATPLWSTGLSLGHGKVTNAAASTADSRNDNIQFNLGRRFSDARIDMPQTWSIDINFVAALQKQRLLIGGETNNTSYTLTTSGQRLGLGSFNLVLTNGLTTQPNGAPGLRLRGVQLEAIYPLRELNSVKLYVRDTNRNIGDPLLAAKEFTAGMQLTVNF